LRVPICAPCRSANRNVVVVPIQQIPGMPDDVSHRPGPRKYPLSSRERTFVFEPQSPRMAVGFRRLRAGGALDAKPPCWRCRPCHRPGPHFRSLILVIVRWRLGEARHDSKFPRSLIGPRRSQETVVSRYDALSPVSVDVMRSPGRIGFSPVHTGLQLYTSPQCDFRFRSSCPTHQVDPCLPKSNSSLARPPMAFAVHCVGAPGSGIDVLNGLSDAS